MEQNTVIRCYQNSAIPGPALADLWSPFPTNAAQFGSLRTKRNVHLFRTDKSEHRTDHLSYRTSIGLLCPAQPGRIRFCRQTLGTVTPSSRDVTRLRHVTLSRHPVLRDKLKLDRSARSILRTGQTRHTEHSLAGSGSATPPRRSCQPSKTPRRPPESERF